MPKRYCILSSIMRTWISQWFLTKILFLFFKNNFTRINHCKFIHHKSCLKSFLSYLPCKVHRQYFSIIFNVKKCVLYSIKYGKQNKNAEEKIHERAMVSNVLNYKKNQKTFSYCTKWHLLWACLIYLVHKLVFLFSGTLYDKW